MFQPKGSPRGWPRPRFARRDTEISPLPAAFELHRDRVECERYEAALLRGRG